VNINRLKTLYAQWQMAQTLAASYRIEAERIWRERERAAFELMLHLPYRRYKKLMHISGGPWF
jgi:hypothetical protein